MSCQSSPEPLTVTEMPRTRDPAPADANQMASWWPLDGGHPKLGGTLSD